MAFPVLAIGGIAGKSKVAKAIGSITSDLGDLLGIGKGASDEKYRARQATQKRNIELAAQGDLKAWHMLGAIGGVKKLPMPLGPPYTSGSTLPKGWWSKKWAGGPGWGVAYEKLVQRAARAYGTIAQPGGDEWQNGNGSVPAATPGSTPTETSPEESAPSAPKPRPKPKPKPASKPKPCPEGSERNPDTGRCRKIPTSPGYGIVARPGGGPKPCPEGSERNPDTGRCRKIRRGAAGKGLTKKQTQLLRRAETAAGRVLAKGARGAVTAVRTAVGSVGGLGGAAVSAALLLAAAAAGWFVGQDIQRSLSGENAQLRIEAANRDRRHAVAAMREQLGRQPTLEEQRPITEAYNRRLALIRAGGFA